MLPDFNTSFAFSHIYIHVYQEQRCIDAVVCPDDIVCREWKCLKFAAAVIPLHFQHGACQ